MRRGISAAAVAAALALAVSACGGEESPRQAAPASDPAAVSGQVTWWDTSDATNEAPVFQEVLKDFTAKYPKIKVNYVNVPFADAQNKFKTAAQSGSGAPDVLRAEVGWVAEFASLGYLAPLDGTQALDKPEEFLPSPAGSGKYAGKTYAVPQVTDTLGLLYNKELLKKAGHDAPPKTFAELKQTALDVKTKAGADGLALNVDAYFLLPFIYGEGGDLLDVAGKKITVAAPASLAGVKVVEDLIASGAAAKPAIQDSYTNAETAFKEGKVAMIFNGPWSNTDNLGGAVFKDKPHDFGIAPVPAGSAKAGSPTGGHDYAVYAGSGDLDASYLFVRYMASAETQARIAGKLGLLPTRRPAYTLPEAQANPMIAKWQEPMAAAVERPWIPEGGQLFQPLLEGYQKLAAGQRPAEPMLKDVAKAYQGLLKGWSL
ncbi:sugar ABC transporter substrate-binding protein [Sphaerisporangium krabiense]|uniref:Arabinogalactan oligomer/maltooligosaccharide transport system substrate-binding protein n=1 Tax=Sphaerisporangium krabiense TaxID=763782 RepID=A0A7W8Z929_9ACTN|nr:extracellular solute-binding protein [Sphaerisporangium krabiense]MBB5629744.1 arabinogalactan oligomer/maltooligosaccharide transport system substrate-binding protein [Sphaerisporangium krabiense]GII63844.1 sugar ABC transporter substrate-binding protein [Sphaerisporangium krabiense]